MKHVRIYKKNLRQKKTFAYNDRVVIASFCTFFTLEILKLRAHYAHPIKLKKKKKVNFSTGYFDATNYIRNANFIYVPYTRVHNL